MIADYACDAPTSWAGADEGGAGAGAGAGAAASLGCGMNLGFGLASAVGAVAEEEAAPMSNTGKLNVFHGRHMVDGEGGGGASDGCSEEAEVRIQSLPVMSRHVRLSVAVRQAGAVAGAAAAA